MDYLSPRRCGTLTALTFGFLISVAPASAATLTVAWDANHDTHTAGYIVYVGTAPGSYSQTHDVGAMTSWTLFDATPGQLYCFAVAAYALGPLVGERSEEVCGYSDTPPDLVNPGNRTSVVGQSVMLQLQGVDPDGRAVSYSATGLPPGLELTPSTGLIAGIPTTVGIYTVTATVHDGVLSASQTFLWTIVDQAGGEEGLDTTPPSLEITSPASGARVASDLLTMVGTASDDHAIASVAWSSNRGGSGLATGTSNWTATVPLQRGRNLITVTATDTAGNQTSRAVTVWW